MSSQNAFVDRATLRSLDIGQRLGGAELEELARKVRVEELPAGRQLFVRGQSDPWTYYLLGGEVALQDQAGAVSTVVGGTPSAKGPLDDHQPRQLTGKAVSPVRFIRIHRSLLEVLGGAGAVGRYDVQEIGPNDKVVDNRLFHEIFHAFMSETLELPHLPDVALRVQQAAEDPDSDLGSIARIVQNDPVLAARLIQVANSPLYGSQNNATTARAAIMLLGLDATRNLVITHAMRTLFTTDSPVLKKRMESLWQHSALTGAIAYAFGEKTHGLDAERSMLAGLLHDIGALPIIHYAAKYPELAKDAAQLESTLVELKGQIGAMLLRKWGFGDEMVQVVLECDQWERNPDPHADYVDAVLAAQYIGADPDERKWMPERDTVPALAKLGIDGLDEETEQQIVHEARSEVGAVLGLFD